MKTYKPRTIDILIDAGRNFMKVAAITAALAMPYACGGSNPSPTNPNPDVISDGTNTNPDVISGGTDTVISGGTNTIPPTPVPTYAVTADITELLSNAVYNNNGNDNAQIVLVTADTTGSTLEERLNNSVYKTSCGTVTKGNTISCTLSGIPDDKSGELYARVGNYHVSLAGVNVDKNTTGTVPLSVEEIFGGNTVISDAVAGTTTSGNCFGSASPLYVIIMNEKNMILPTTTRIRGPPPEVTMGEMNGGEALLIEPNAGMPGDYNFKTLLEDKMNSTYKNKQVGIMILHDFDKSETATTCDVTSNLYILSNKAPPIYLGISLSTATDNTLQ